VVETAGQAAVGSSENQGTKQFGLTKIRLGAGSIRLAAAPIGNPQVKSGLAQGKVGFSLTKTGGWHGKSGLSLRPASSFRSEADWCWGKRDFASGSGTEC
jgi:hypothetical protein